MHLGNAIKTIIMAVDPPLIIIGGSVAARPENYYQDAMWESISERSPFPPLLDSFRRLSFRRRKNIAIKGAAALCPVPSLNKPIQQLILHG